MDHFNCIMAYKTTQIVLLTRRINIKLKHTARITRRFIYRLDQGNLGLDVIYMNVILYYA